MKTFDKIVGVLARNIAYTVTLAVAIVLFAIFSDGLLPGLITAASAMVAYVCIELLYKEFKNASEPRSVKKTTAKSTKKKK